MYELPAPVTMALDRLQEAGYEAYLVGGCVRDLLRGKRPQDYDLTTSALPEQTEAVFDGERLVKTGLRHGTVTALLEGMALEITTFRVDGTYSDARRPDAVRFTPLLTEDLARRDFTVNAMAWSPATGLTDPFGGREDLEARVLRCVGDPALRFTEDALRILRALRFSATLAFSIEAETGEALRELAPRLPLVSAERVYSELCKLLCGVRAGQVLLDWTDVLGEVLPELLPMRGFDQRNRHHCYDVLTHAVRTLEGVPPVPELRWAALLHDLGKPAAFTLDEKGEGHFKGHPDISAALTEQILRRLRASRATRETVTELVRLHDRQIEPTARAVRRVLSRYGAEFFSQLMQLKRADNLAQAPAYRDRQQLYDRIEALARDILREKPCLSLRELAVDGNDLMALGIPRGPKLGQTLQALFDGVLSGALENERETLLRAAQTVSAMSQDDRKAFHESKEEPT